MSTKESLPKGKARSKAKKLKLSKETLKDLESTRDEAEKVKGGIIRISRTCFPGCL